MIASMSLRMTRVLCAVFLLSLLAVPSAVAAPGWIAPIGVSEGPTAESGGGVWGGVPGEPHVAFDARGDALAAWQREDGTLEGGVKKYEVQVVKDHRNSSDVIMRNPHLVECATCWVSGAVEAVA